MDTKLQDISISGVGSIAGGTYDSIEINGCAKLEGNIECKTIEINGSGKSLGNVKSDNFTVNGAYKVCEDLQSKEITIAGMCKIFGNCEVDKLDASGIMKVEKDIVCEKAKIGGSLKCKGNYEGEHFSCSGNFKIGGLLNCGNVQINIEGKSRSREIGGENITVKKGRNKRLFGFLNVLFSERNKLVTDIIEGDNVYLENTIAKIVRGKNIEIGDGCDIQVIEYKESLKVTGKSRISEQNQI